MSFQLLLVTEAAVKDDLHLAVVWLFAHPVGPQLGEVAGHRENVSLRFYDLPNVHRVIITDNVAYLTIYRQAEHGRNSPCIVARSPGLMYDYALLLFGTAWEHSRPAE
ncbi:hypothetical protein [Streptosporangium sp. CA-115845]|uniref:hypothetical protein n=1 Tax=Streptosporangium sp. CA-115845 TaxID=3240071 RepID=UPI003D940AD3